MRVSDDSDEILDLVTNDDKVIGRLSREKVYRNNLTNFRTINVFAINNKNQVWFPIRHHKKKLWPNMIDASIGGHVISGETYFDAFKRESMEEARLDISNMSWKLITKLLPYKDKTGSFTNVYVIFCEDKEIKFNKNDFKSGDWIDFNLIEKFLASKLDKMKPDLPILIDALIKDYIIISEK